MCLPLGVTEGCNQGKNSPYNKESTSHWIATILMLYQGAGCVTVVIKGDYTQNPIGKGDCFDSMLKVNLSSAGIVEALRRHIVEIRLEQNVSPR